MSLVYLWIMAAVPIVAIPPVGHDDGLFVFAAAKILNGQWLGPYHSLTLIKGPFFPVFLAMNWILGLPLLVTESFYRSRYAPVDSADEWKLKCRQDLFRRIREVSFEYNSDRESYLKSSRKLGQSIWLSFQICLVFPS